jgi:hypothetical protein
MFIFKSKKIIVDCFTMHQHVADLSPIVKASEVMPDWWKKTSVDPNNKTLKSCVGVTNIYQKGFMVPIASDLNIHLNKNEFRWTFSEKTAGAEIHPTNRWDNFASPQEYVALKILSPWYIKTKQDISWYLADPFWNQQLNKDYRIASGMINFKYQHESHTNIFIPLSETEFTIKHNTPMNHIIPLTENKVELKLHVVSEEEIKKLVMPLISFDNSYLKIKNILSKKEGSKCPFHRGK